MDELLLPSGEEEARSEHSSCVPGDADGSMGDRVGARLRRLLQGTVKGELRRSVRDFCRRNGLLTLSVVAVLTGCTLGFMLRGTHLSTQVHTQTQVDTLWGEPFPPSAALAPLWLHLVLMPECCLFVLFCFGNTHDCQRGRSHCYTLV